MGKTQWMAMAGAFHGHFVMEDPKQKWMIKGTPMTMETPILSGQNVSQCGVLRELSDPRLSNAKHYNGRKLKRGENTAQRMFRIFSKRHRQN